MARLEALVIVLVCLGSALGDCPNCQLNTFPTPPNCASVYAFPNNCSLNFGVTDTTANINGTCSPTTYSCDGGTSFYGDPVSYDCNACRANASFASKCCTRPVLAQQTVAASTGCKLYHTKCSSASPNYLGTPFSIEPKSIENNTQNTSCYRSPLGCPKNYVASYIKGRSNYEYWYYCTDPNCNKISWQDCTNCTACKSGYAEIDDGSCQYIISLNMYYTYNKSGVWPPVPQQVTPCSTTAVALSTEHDRANCTFRLYPVYSGYLGGSKMPWTANAATASKRWCTINASMNGTSGVITTILNQTTALPAVKGYLTGYVDVILPLGSYSVNCYIAASNGLESNCTTQLTVTDMQPPYVYCYNITIYTDDDKNYSTYNWPRIPSSWDNIGVVNSNCTNGPVNNQFPFNNQGSFSRNITCYASDAARNVGSCWYLIYVRDLQNPDLTCPSATVNNTKDMSYGKFNFNVTVWDNVQVYNWSCVPGLTANYGIGNTRVTCRAYDTSRNYGYCDFNATVYDTQPPALNCTQITVAADATGPQANVVLSALTRTKDNSGYAVNIVCTPGGYPDIGLFPFGLSYALCNATDPWGNRASCNIPINVIDLTPPVLTCPSYSIVTAPGVNYGVLVSTYESVTAWDNVNVTNISCIPNPSNGTYHYPFGRSAVTCRAADAAKNVGICTFNMSVIDNQAPLVTCPSSSTYGTYNTSNIKANLSTASGVMSWDNVAIGKAQLNASFLGGSQFTLLSNATSYVFPTPGTMTLTYTVWDTTGLSSVCFWAVTVFKMDLPPDLTPPNFYNCSSPVINNTRPSTNPAWYNSSYLRVYTNTSVGQSFGKLAWAEPTAYDNSGVVTTYYQAWSPSLFIAATYGLTVGTYVIDFTAIDNNGNTADCVYLAIVQDYEVPRFQNCPRDMEYFTGNLPGAYLTNWPLDGIYAADNFRISNPYGSCQSVPPGYCPTGGTAPSGVFPPGFYKFSYVASDDSGNLATPCYFNVTVKDSYPPTIVGCDNNTVITVLADSTGKADIFSMCPTLYAVDNVPLPVSTVYTSSPAGYDCTTPIPITYTTFLTIQFVATDYSGLSSHCDIHVTVLDHTAPSFTGCDSSAVNYKTLECDPGVSTALMRFDNITVTDNSGPVALTWSPANLSTQIGVFPFGTSLVQVSAQDPSFNKNYCFFSVTVIDTQAPIIHNFYSNTTDTWLINTVTDPGLPTATVDLPNLYATDNVALRSQGFYSVTFAGLHAGPTNFSVGTTIVNYNALDTSFNPTAVTITINVADLEAPYFHNCLSVNNSIPYYIILNTTEGRSTGIPSWPLPNITDNYNRATQLRVELTSDPVGFTTGSAFPVGDVVMLYTATDTSENTAECTFVVRVQDFEPPTIACPNDFTIYTINGLDKEAEVRWLDAVAHDNNFVSYTAELLGGPISGKNYSVGAYNVTYVAYDVSNNMASCTFHFYVAHPIPPQSSSSTDVAAIAGSVAAAFGGVVALVCFIFLVLLLYQRREHKRKLAVASAGYAELLNMSDEYILERARNIQETLMEQRQESPPMAVLHQVIHPERKFAAPPEGVLALEAYMRETVGKEISRGDLEFGKVLGSGEFGEVCEGYYLRPDPKQKVAIKKLRQTNSEESKASFLKEAAIMAQFNHPNIVGLVGVCTLPNTEPTLIVLEYMHLGALLGYLQSPMVKGQLRLLTMIRMALDIGAGMQYLAESGFVHRDLAARNVLIDKTMTCRIGDFGLSVDLGANAGEDPEATYSGVTNSNKVPIRWTAIEAICFRQYSTASDVWSFGVLLWEIWTYGEMPYKGWPNKKVTEQVSMGYRLNKPVGCPDSIYEVMIKCWNKNVKRRLTFAKANSMLVDAWNEASRESKPAHLMGGGGAESNYATGDVPEYGIYDNNDEPRWGDEGKQDYLMTNEHALYEHGEGGAIYDQGGDGVPAYQEPAEDKWNGEADRIYDTGGLGVVITNRERDLAFQDLLDSVIMGRADESDNFGGMRRNVGREDLGKRVFVVGRGEGVLRYFGMEKGSNRVVGGVELDGFTGDHDGSVQGFRYFSCAADKGIICDPRLLRLEDMTGGLVVNSIYDEDAVSAPAPVINRALKPRESTGYLFVGAEEE